MEIFPTMNSNQTAIFRDIFEKFEQCVTCPWKSFVVIAFILSLALGAQYAIVPLRQSHGN